MTSNCILEDVLEAKDVREDSASDKNVCAKYLWVGQRRGPRPSSLIVGVWGLCFQQTETTTKQKKTKKKRMSTNEVKTSQPGKFSNFIEKRS